MNQSDIPPLVDCEWLADHLDDPTLAILDASFFLPNQGRDAGGDFLAEHIESAQFFDIDEIADRTNPLPHMLPSPAGFAEAVGRLGIGNATHVIAYDNNAFMASARAWWMFRVFGHDRVSVLDGGLQRWRDLNLPLVSGAPEPAVACRFDAGFRPDLVRSLEQMRDLLGEPHVDIVDARSPGRFAGSEPEPRPGVRSGHIPGSRNVPYRSLVDETSGEMKALPEIAATFETAGTDVAGPLVTTCGTGVTAAILALALFRLGRADVAVYDGSWTEWGGRTDTPIA